MIRQYYQLLPRARHNAAFWKDEREKPIDDLLDPELWQEMKWGLSGEDEKTNAALTRLMPDVTSMKERREIAQLFQRKALRALSNSKLLWTRPLSRLMALKCF